MRRSTASASETSEASRGLVRSIAAFSASSAKAPDMPVDDRAVPSRLLGLIEGTIGRVEELAGGDAVRREAGHPTAHRHLLRLAGERRPNLGPKPLGKLIALELVRLRGEHGELLATQARDHVAGPGRPPERLGELDERAVPCGVPEAVVELLEPVQVQHHYRQGPPTPGRALELAGESLLELAAVREAGQGVGAGRRAQLGQRSSPI